MNFFRAYHKSNLLLWVTLLSLTLLCTQHLQLHVHSLDHEPYQHHDNLLSNNSDHSHIVTKHLSIDTSHQDHHDEVMLEMNASPDTISHSSSAQVPSFDLLILYILLLVLGAYRSLGFKTRPFAEGIRKRHFYLIPQLRAPPY